MDIKKETEYREKFIQLLYDLAKSENVLESSDSRKKFFLRLEDLYHSKDNDEEFRHYYSDIFSVLTTVQQESDLGDINILGQNIDILRKRYRSVNNDENGKTIDVSNQIKKLYDHVSLDIARITYSDAADYKITQNENINSIKSKVNALQDKVNNTNKLYRKTRNKINASQREYIAILGIFASVILTFMGGIVFSSSVLQNIHNASIYRIVLISLIIGLVLINVFYFLFYFIERIVKNRGKNKGKLFYILNAIIIVLILLTCVCWYFGIVEKRNSFFSQNNSVISTTQNNTVYKLDNKSETKKIKDN